MQDQLRATQVQLRSTPGATAALVAAKAGKPATGTAADLVAKAQALTGQLYGQEKPGDFFLGLAKLGDELGKKAKQGMVAVVVIAVLFVVVQFFRK